MTALERLCEPLRSRISSKEPEAPNESLCCIAKAPEAAICLRGCDDNSRRFSNTFLTVYPNFRCLSLSAFYEKLSCKSRNPLKIQGFQRYCTGRKGTAHEKDLAATDQKAGGSNPSRRASSPQAYACGELFCFFLPIQPLRSPSLCCAFRFPVNHFPGLRLFPMQKFILLLSNPFPLCYNNVRSGLLPHAAGSWPLQGGILWKSL